MEPVLRWSIHIQTCCQISIVTLYSHAKQREKCSGPGSAGCKLLWVGELWIGGAPFCIREEKVQNLVDIGLLDGTSLLHGLLLEEPNAIRKNSALELDSPF